MSGTLPGVMVSSTFFDLQQIRQDLLQFIEKDLGYRALLSEHHTFPIDPDANAVENCRRRVEQDVDIFVLIIGARYGSIDSASAKSVTNLEYLSAREKGVPIYAFLDKKILALIGVWESNPTADFSKQVDNTKLFEFVKQIRSEHSVWTSPFEHAHDIVNTLRTQFAYLMRDGLSRALQVKKCGIPPSVLTHLSPEAYRLALEKPSAWEYRLFGQTLADHLAVNAELRRDLKAGRHLNGAEDVADVGKWMKSRIEEAGRLAEASASLINTDLKNAFGPEGVPGDAAEILFVAQKLGEIHRRALEWSLRVNGALGLDNRHKRIAKEMAMFLQDLISKIETLAAETIEKLRLALESPPGSPLRKIHMSLHLEITNAEAFNKAIQEAIAAGDPEE